jgi:pimeloyl-ACP methyl ester carboxylesterase
MADPLAGHPAVMLRAAFVLRLALLCAVPLLARAQVPERTIEEIKVEAAARAERGAYPLGGLDPKDAAEALSLIQTRDRDEWAQAWSTVAQRYLDEATRATAPAAAAAAYRRAWRLFYFAQWPVPNSPGKRVAYERALDAYARYARTLDPPLETVRIPFEGGAITAYLRLPKAPERRVPMILAISGLDSRKETVAESYGQILARGVGFIAVDGPGTGQAPLKVSATADRMFSAVLDYLAQHPRVDGSRIIVSGVSFGAYWAAKLAITERARLLGAVAQSPPVDEVFSERFLRQETLGNREYLFDLVPAFLTVFEGVQTVDDLARVMPGLSLRQLGLLNKPTTPMLIVAGAKDTQVPIADIELLMRSGDVPKEAWVNPRGGHLGRELRGWTDPVIFDKVIIPWELRLIEQSRH